MNAVVLAMGVWLVAPSPSGPGPVPSRLRADPPANQARPPLAPAKRPSSLRVEWFGLRAGVGLSPGYEIQPYISLMLGGELTFFTLVWRHFYWEILRGGWHIPYGPHWGTAMGYPFRIRGQENHQIRVGAHLSLEYGILPYMSGLQIYYLYRMKRRFALQAGLMFFAVPPGGVLTFGFSI